MISLSFLTKLLSNNEVADELRRLTETRSSDPTNAIFLGSDPVDILATCEVVESSDGTLHLVGRGDGEEILFVVPGLVVEALLPRSYALKRIVKNNPDRLVQRVTIASGRGGYISDVASVVNAVGKVIHQTRPTGEVVLKKRFPDEDDLCSISAEAPLVSKLRTSSCAKPAVPLSSMMDPEGVLAERIGQSRDLRYTEDNVVTYSEYLMANGSGCVDEIPPSAFKAGQLVEMAFYVRAYKQVDGKRRVAEHLEAVTLFSRRGAFVISNLLEEERDSGRKAEESEKPFRCPKRARYGLPALATATLNAGEAMEIAD